MQPMNMNNRMTNIPVAPPATATIKTIESSVGCIPSVVGMSTK